MAENHYDVTYHEKEIKAKELGENISLIDVDPTSYFKLSTILDKTIYSNIFIVIEEKEDAQYILKNIALIKNNARIVLVNQWDDNTIGLGFENITIIHSDELMAAHLYDNLPNVPLVAKNVGLGRGEIMEIHVPFGSSYAYRHVGSILQRKWKIVAVYRDEKQILPTAATMIRPNDTLLVVGKPLVLDGIYKTINKRIGFFPEPFGKNLYLVLDFRHDQKKALDYIKESIYLLDKLENKSLYIRILNQNNFDLVDKIKRYEGENIFISICYDDIEMEKRIEYDIYQYDTGLILNSIKTFETNDLKNALYSVKKLVYLFGEKKLSDITQTVVLMSQDEKMESISSTAFDISESLGLSLILGDFDPDGDFESRKMIVEYYETLTHIFNMQIDIQQKVANPIRELSNLDKILQVAPFEKPLNTDSFIKLFSTKVENFLLTSTRHPKLLVPFVLSEGKEEG